MICCVFRKQRPQYKNYSKISDCSPTDHPPIPAGSHSVQKSTLKKSTYPSLKSGSDSRNFTITHTSAKANHQNLF